MHLTDPEAVVVLDGWGVYERQMYGEEMYAHELSLVTARDFDPPDGAFLVASDDGRIVAGGGLRKLSPDTGEIKRMWTAPDQRRMGYASAILDEIECAGRELGYSRLRLETGPEQHEARALYGRRYRQIPTYHYEGAIAFECSLRSTPHELGVELGTRVRSQADALTDGTTT